MLTRGRPSTRLLSGESGQSLVVVLVSLLVLLGMAAVGIDTASWMVRRHQAQVVADSSALAAANCLANPSATPTSMDINGTLTSVPACTSGSDVSDAQTVAVDYAAANGVTITTSQVNVNTTNDLVTVSPSVQSPGLFARLFGIGQVTESAQAAAHWDNGPSPCPSARNDTGCAFMFADNSNCSSATNGVDLNSSGTTGVTGVIISNSNLSGSTNGTPKFGTASYGPNGPLGACSDSITSNGQIPWTSPPTQASAYYPFPVDYALDFPACYNSGSAVSGELPCQASGTLKGYPPFCTNGGSNITFSGSANGDLPITGNIYCAVGTGTPSDPSTWNGAITINVRANHDWYDTFVGGTIDYKVNGNETLSACGYDSTGYNASTCNPSVPTPVTGNYPIFYATGTAATALDVTVRGGQTLNGDMYVPNGTAYLYMTGNKMLTTLIEGNNINATKISGTFQGDGPIEPGFGSSGSGNDQLVALGS